MRERATTTRDRPAPNVLSAVEFDVVWRGLGLGAPPVVLQLPSPGRTHRERRRVEAEVWATLRDRGLGPGSDLAQLLGLLAAPSPRVEVRAWGTSTRRAVIAAIGSDGGVVARRHDDTVVVEPCGRSPAPWSASWPVDTPDRAGPPAFPARSWMRRYAARRVRACVRTS